MASAWDVLGLILGILGALVVFQLGWEFLYNQLPDQKLKMLQDMLADTYDLFESVTEDGLLPERTYVESVEHRLSSLRDYTDDLRNKVYRAISFRMQVEAMMHGVSRQITEVYHEVVELRADISFTSERHKKRIELAVRQAQQPISPLFYPAPPDSFGFHDVPDVPTVDDSTIPRPQRARRRAAVNNQTPAYSYDVAHNVPSYPPTSITSAIQHAVDAPREQPTAWNVGGLFDTIAQLNSTVTSLTSAARNARSTARLSTSSINAGNSSEAIAAPSINLDESSLLSSSRDTSVSQDAGFLADSAHTSEEHLLNPLATTSGSFTSALDLPSAAITADVDISRVRQGYEPASSTSFADNAVGVQTPPPVCDDRVRSSSSATTFEASDEPRRPPRRIPVPAESIS